MPQATIEIGAARVGGDINFQFGLSAASPSFRALVRRFIESYLGTADAPVPFGGRDPELALLNDWLADRKSASNLLITAPAGRGKTALLVRWVASLRPDWPVAFIPISIRYETNRAPVFYQAFAARLAEILDEALPGTPADPAVYYKDKVIEYLDRIGQSKQRCLVVIDGLDEASGWRVDTTVLPSHPPAGLKIVVSARQLAGDQGSQQWLDRLGWMGGVGGARTYEVPPLGRDGIAAVLVSMGFPLGGLAANVDIVSELYRLTERGDPLLLDLYVKDLWRKGESATRLQPSDLKGLAPGFGAYFKKWFTEQRDAWQASKAEINEADVDATLAILACAFGPIKLPTLEDLLNDILPGRRIITVRSIEPLQRFVVGDGVQTGYVLAHPKLAEYLQREYFGGSRVLANTKQAFVAWASRIVRELNERQREPEPAPTYEYALLHFTQHLEAITPPQAALPLYAELVEDGWRRAWQAFEGGYQGFSRDIGLAARAFRAAAQRSIAHLKQPRTGLGGQIRCMLCLSSIRSTGLAVPGAVLAEFLRDGILGAKQALYLAQLKEEKKQAATFREIAPLLGQNLLLEAYAGARDIANAEARYETLAAIAPSLPEKERERAFVEAFHAAAAIPTKYTRDRAFEQLQPRLPASFDAKAKIADIEARLASPEPKAAEPAAASASAEPSEGEEVEALRDDDFEALCRAALDPKVTPQRLEALENLIRSRKIDSSSYFSLRMYAPKLPDTFVFALLEASIRHPNIWLSETAALIAPRLSHAQLAQVLRWIGGMKPGFDAYHALSGIAPTLPADLLRQSLDVAINVTEIWFPDFLEILTPRMSEELVAAALQLFAKGGERSNGYEIHRTLKVLAPSLSQQNLDLGLQIVFDAGDYWMTDSLALLAPELSEAQMEHALRRTALIEDRRRARSALDVLAPRLSPPLLARTFREALAAGEQGQSVLAGLAPHLPEDLAREAFAIVRRSLDAALMEALVPKLPVDLLSEALTLTATVPDIEVRGTILAALLPRLREAGLPTAIQDAYKVAFVIGDRSFVAFALAALMPYLPASEAEELVAQVSASLADLAPATEEGEAFLRSAALALLSEHLPEPEARTALERSLTGLRDSKFQGSPLKEFAGFLAPRFPPAEGQSILAEALAVARHSEEDVAPAIVGALAPLFAEKDAPAVLQEAVQLAAKDADPDSIPSIFISLAAMIVPGRSEAERLSMMADLRARLARLQDADARLALHIVVAAIAPALPPAEWAGVLKAAMAPPPEDADEITRLLQPAALAPYLEPAELHPALSRFLEAGARGPRPVILSMLATMQGLAAELYKGNVVVAGNRIPGSPIERLGGPVAVSEMMTAIRDVSRWWP